MIECKYIQLIISNKSAAVWRTSKLSSVLLMLQNWYAGVMQLVRLDDGAVALTGSSRETSAWKMQFTVIYYTNIGPTADITS